MRIHTKKGIYTYNYIEKQKVGSEFVLVGVDQGVYVNICEPVPSEEPLDQYLNYIKHTINEAERLGQGTNLVIDLTRLGEVASLDNFHFCLVAYSKEGKLCLALERNYLGVDGEDSLLSVIRTKAEASGGSVTNACSLNISKDKLIIKELYKNSIYAIDYLLLRNGLDRKLIQHLKTLTGREIKNRFEIITKTSKIIQGN